MPSEGIGLIVLFEKAPLLEDRHHQFVEILQPPALRCDHETIYRASPEPAFTCIGHLLGAADEVGAWNGEPAGDLPQRQLFFFGNALDVIGDAPIGIRSEEHTSELQSLMRISYAVFCLIQKHPDI